MTDVVNWVRRQEALLAVEREEEQQQRQEKCEEGSIRVFQRLQGRGDAIMGLHAESPSLSGDSSSLEGHSLLVLSRSGNSLLPSHRFTTGDNVSLQNLASNKATRGAKKASGSDSEVKGVVYKVQREQITIAAEDVPEDLGFSLFTSHSLLLLKLADEVTYNRLNKVLQKLEGLANSPTARATYDHNERLISVLFHHAKPALNKPLAPLQLHNERLNASQREAVEFCLRSSDIALIHGPPGTGKTTTVVEFILQCVDRGEKVLACAPSNVAVDNLVLGLLPYLHQAGGQRASGPRIIRAGHPARMLPEVLQYSLEHILQSSDGMEVVQDVLKDIQEATRAIPKAPCKAARQHLYRELKQLRKELGQRQKKAVRDLIKRADVMLTTNTGCDSKYLGLYQLAAEMKGFDVVVIDEAAQALEVSCWIAILLGKKVVLAGDHLQLPPTILSRKAAGAQPDGSPGLELTLFDRLTQQDASVARLLDTQYRMNENIMQWSSAALYEGRIAAGDSVARHLLCDLDYVGRSALTSMPLCLIDTCGEVPEQRFDEEKTPPGKSGAFVQLESKWNEGEAEIVKNMVQELLHQGLLPSDIGVITPYNAQVETLRATLADHEGLEIGSVDGFQGREKEAVVISMVRSNPEGEIGFLSEKRRMNVAVTRARRLVVVVCDGTTICRDPFLNGMLEYFQEAPDSLYLTQYDYMTQLDHSEEELARASARAKEAAARATAKAVAQREQEAQRVEEAKAKAAAKKKRRDERVQQEIDGLVAAFLERGDRSFSFPAEFTSFQRMSVHQVAEARGLLHHTAQVGEVRIVTIENPAIPETPAAPQEPVAEESIPSESSPVEETPVVTEPEQPEKLEPVPVVPKPATGSAEKSAGSGKTSGSKKKGKNKKRPAQQKREELGVAFEAAPVLKGQKVARGEDIDSLLASLSIKEPNTCCFGTCQRPTNVLTSECKYCGAKYCHNHTMAEKHGCGDAVRGTARREWLQTCAGNAPLNEKEKDAARDELRKKISSSAKKRKGKGGNGKKKK